MYIWQTKKWLEMLKKSWQISDFFEVPLSKSFPQGEKDFLFVEKRSIWLGLYGLFVLWVQEKNLNKNILSKLKNLAKEQKTLFIQIETLNYNNLSKIENQNWFKNWYYKKFITPYTAIIDLEQTEEEILAKMKQKWRYNIKIAQKKWIVVKEVEKTKENIEKYYKLMLETTSRDNFSGHSLDYYINFLDIIDNSKLLLAYKDEEVIAWWIFVFDKEVSIYYYWASTSQKKYRNMMAPYLVQWEAIKIAKSINSKIYDFLWVAPLWVKNHPLSWVTSFKSKFSTDFRKVSESYIFIRNKFLYFIVNFLRKIKKG